MKLGAGAAGLLCVACIGSAAASELPEPVKREDVTLQAPVPQWDLGLLVGVCGVGQESFWQGTDFCGALLGEAHFLRSSQNSWGLGPYAQLATSGFFDFRASLGPSLHIPLSQVLAGTLRAGGLLHTQQEQAAAGFELFAELGVRSLNLRGRYALTHSFVTGLQVVPDEDARARTTFWLALRLDAFWLAAPFGMLGR